MQQLTEEWFNAKLGKVGASHISDVMAKTKSGAAASRENYMMQLILEKITGKRVETYTSPAMQYGIEMEAEARQQYEAETFNLVTECGFILHPEIENTGASPDGLVGDDGLLEIKCFQPANHLNYLLTDKIERKYILQMQWQIECTGRKWVDFVAYNPSFPLNMRMFLKKVLRDEEIIAEIKKEVIDFNAEMRERIELIQKNYGG